MLKNHWETFDKTFSDGTVLTLRSVPIRSTRQARNLLREIVLVKTLPNGKKEIVKYSPLLAEMREHEYQHIAENRINEDNRLILGGRLAIGKQPNGAICILYSHPPDNPPQATFRNHLAPTRGKELPNPIDLAGAAYAWMRTRQSNNGDKPKTPRTKGSPEIPRRKERQRGKKRKQT